MGLSGFFAGRRVNTQTPAATTARTTAQGGVVGLIAENGAHVWRGLPFAASTAGANRWRAPQPPASWAGQRQAVEFSDRCAQLTTRSDERFGLKPGIVVGSEDCLALDIYAPDDARDRALPVMVWIHGGGNVWGRSSTYDGSRLARNQDVVVVAVHHRLGPLGWFSHAALRSTATEVEDTAACFATLDLIAALRWVQVNIAEFGGNPDNVTIFGVSSGGHNVVTLLASPLAKGLFHRAIVQSGAFDSVTLAEAEGGEGDLANSSRIISARLGVSSADQLRDVTPRALIEAYTMGVSGFLDVPRVIQDGVVLPEYPLRRAFGSTHTFNVVPILLGTNRDEMKLFYFTNPELTEKKLGVLVGPRDQKLYDAVTGYLSRVWRIRAVDEPATIMNEAGHRDVYSYRFDWDDGGRFLSMDFKTALGAAHGFEVPFVFNRFTHLGDADRILFQKHTKESRERLSRVIGEYWAAFARDGKPYRVGGPAWPVYAEHGGSYMQLDSESDSGVRIIQHADSLDVLVADLNSDPDLDDTQRRFIINEMRGWMFTTPILADLEAAVPAGR